MLRVVGVGPHGVFFGQDGAVAFNADLDEFGALIGIAGGGLRGVIRLHTGDGDTLPPTSAVGDRRAIAILGLRMIPAVVVVNVVEAGAWCGGFARLATEDGRLIRIAVRTLNDFSH